MSDKPGNDVNKNSSPLEPDQTGSNNTQLPGKVESDLNSLPIEKAEGRFPTGIVSALELGKRPTNVLNELLTWAASELYNRQERSDKLQDDLMKEKVSHARTDEKLKSRLIQSGVQLFSVTMGGIFLGISLGDLTFGDKARIIFGILGIVMVGFGCIPIVLTRLKSRD